MALNLRNRSFCKELDFSPYQVNADMVKKTGNPQVKFLHCLPSLHNRDTVVGEQLYQRTGLSGLQVTDEMFESRSSLVFAQAETACTPSRRSWSPPWGLTPAGGGRLGRQRLAGPGRAADAQVQAEGLDADALLLLTDVPAVQRNFGAADAEPIGHTTPAELRRIRFPAGRWDPRWRPSAGSSSTPAEWP